MGTGLTEEDLNPPTSGGSNRYQYTKLEDGRVVLFDPQTGDFLDPTTKQPIGNMNAPDQGPTIPLAERAITSRRGGSERVVGSRGYDTEPTVKYGTRIRNVPISSTQGQAAVAGALGVDPAAYQYVQALVSAGVITPSTAQKMLGLGGDAGGGGGGDGSAWASLAQRQAEFEYQKQYQAERDRVSDAMNTLQTLANMQQLEDQRAQAMRSNQLSALPFMVDPGMSHFPGLGPNDAVTGRYGLTSPVAVQHQRFDPALGANQYDTQVADALAGYKRLAGVQ